MRVHTLVASSLVATGIACAAFFGCENKHEAQEKQQAASGNLGASANITDLMKARNLSEADV